MAESPVEYESRRCTCAGKKDQPAHSPREPGPCDPRINARRATATPCSSNFSREWRERGSATEVGLPRTSSLRELYRLSSNKHSELKVSLGVLLHPEHRFEVEACRVGRTCRAIDLGSIKVSSADGQSFRSPKVKSRFGVSPPEYHLRLVIRTETYK